MPPDSNPPFFDKVRARLWRIADHTLGQFRSRPLTIVTGSDFSHAKSLVQFLESVVRHEPKAKLVVYDLGLSPDQRKEIDRLFPQATVRNFPYERYPDWFDIRTEAGQYAWKPVIVEAVLQESSGPVIWLDAGNMLVGRLSQIYGRVNRTGFYSQTSSDDLKTWTHEKTLSYFGVNKDWARGKLNVHGACVAFNPSHQAGADLAKKWSDYAQVREAIAPPGSSRANHRQDQALLGVLAHQAGLGPQQREICYQLKTHCDIDSPQQK